MISKTEFIECAITKFTMFGSKRVILDELSDELGISKKIIYKYFLKKKVS